MLIRRRRLRLEIEQVSIQVQADRPLPEGFAPAAPASGSAPARPVAGAATGTAGIPARAGQRQDPLTPAEPSPQKLIEIRENQR